MAKHTFQLKSLAYSRFQKEVAFAVLGVLLGALLMTGFLSLLQTMAAGDVPVAAEFATNVAEPMRLRVPAVGIDTTFEGPLGVNDDQTIQVPDSYEELGWYQHAPLPGALGPAVILGHVDSYEGPAVFFDLKNTQPGDVIEIQRADGSTAVFAVTRLLHREQADFPTEEVYGDIDHAGLRLITCSGTYDHGEQVYSHNLIVFAALIDELPAPGR